MIIADPDLRARFNLRMMALGISANSFGLFMATAAYSPQGAAWVDELVEYLDGNAHLPAFPLDVQATAFQAKVWQALRDIPHGTTLSYSELAQAVGDPNASRAVASACARNPVALTIPCHRIVPKTGGFGGYRWDPARKKRLLEIERLG